jgi:hypothetical protein
MPTQYVLIDYENVQPKDLAVLDGQPFNVIVFLGANQAKISSELADALQQRGERGRYVRISGNGRNALDFHIAFYLGELAARDTSASFHVLSKDKDYDPLIEHLRSKRIEVRRSETLAEIVPPAEDQIETLIEYLKGMESRPGRVKKLANAIKARLGALEEGQIQTLVTELERRGVISVTEKTIHYHFAAES